jgi:hypothetical protein
LRARLPLLAVGLVMGLALLSRGEEPTHAPVDRSPTSGEPCSVVIVPGFEGSRLADTAGLQVWPPEPMSLLWWGLIEDLSIHRPLVPTGIVLNVPVVTDLVVRPVYGPLVDALSQEGCRVIPFAYDWRQDLSETAERFARFVTENAYHELPIIAHSLGGLVVKRASAMVTLRGDVFYVAVPFRSGLGFLRDLQNGSPVGFRRTFLPARLLQTYPSTYVIFAEHEPRMGGASVFALEMWLPGPAASERSAVERDDIARAIARAHASRQAFEALPPDPSARAHVIAGTGEDTPASAMADAEGWWSYDRFSTDGDGRVLSDDAIPAGFPSEQVFRTAGQHSRLLEDPAVHATILGIVRPHGGDGRPPHQKAPLGARPTVPPIDEGSR